MPIGESPSDRVEGELRPAVSADQPRAAEAPALSGRSRVTWDRPRVLQAIRRWVELYGEPPRFSDWSPSAAKSPAQLWRVERYRQGDPMTGASWPPASTVKRLYGGSLLKALEAAGYKPARSGRRPRASNDTPSTTSAPETHEKRSLAHTWLAGLLDELDAGERALVVLNAAEVERDLARAELANRCAALVRARRTINKLEEARDTLDVGDARQREAERLLCEARTDLADVRSTLKRRDGELAAAHDEIAQRDASFTREPPKTTAAHERQQAELANVRAALTQRVAELGVAQQEAIAARESAAIAERQRAQLAETVAGHRRVLSPTEMTALREDGPAGPAMLAQALKTLAHARAENGRSAQREALRAIMAAAASWQARL